MSVKIETQVIAAKAAPRDAIVVPGAPQVAGLSFRRFRGEEDFPAMLTVIEGSKDEDGLERSETLEDLARSYRHLVNSDPYEDMLFAEIDGEVIGYSRVWWAQIDDGPRIYSHLAFVLPAWRGKGIRRAMVRHSERRLRAIAADHPAELTREFEAWSSNSEHHWTELLESEGYRPIRYGFIMVRPSLEEIPDLPLPQGLEVRTPTPEQYDVVWDAAREAFRDHWGFSEEEWDDESLKAWQESPIFTPELWQVAWDGDEVAGMVLNFIDDAENREYNRKRGYTETICVRRPWRRRGIARALIARSLHVHKDQGMTEAALGVDAENPNGALQLYESMGYETVKRFITYRKPFDAEPSPEKETSNDCDMRTSHRGA